MRAKLLSLIAGFILLPTSCFAWGAGDGRGFVGTVAESGDCSTDSLDQSQDTGTVTVYLSIGANGQSFQVSESGKLSAISVNINAFNAGSELSVRWGTGSDLTTVYEADEDLTDSDITGAGWYKIVFATKGDVTTGTTYYFGLVEDSGSVSVKKVSSNAYANGQIYGPGTGFALGSADSGSDMAFRVYLCD